MINIYKVSDAVRKLGSRTDPTADISTSGGATGENTAKVRLRLHFLVIAQDSGADGLSRGRRKPQASLRVYNAGTSCPTIVGPLANSGRKWGSLRDTVLQFVIPLLHVGRYNCIASCIATVPEAKP